MTEKAKIIRTPGQRNKKKRRKKTEARFNKSQPKQNKESLTNQIGTEES
jgi:hypothetical protein